jgi:hypothetical protein
MRGGNTVVASLNPALAPAAHAEQPNVHGSVPTR